MSLPSETIWEIDRHTIVKHEILKRYLQAWFSILGTTNRKILYIDGFSGPGSYKNGEDGSPITALKAATDHNLSGDVLFLFIDEDCRRVEHLDREIAKGNWPQNYDIKTKCGKFHEIIIPILDHIEKRESRLIPTFAFVDPFGFSGIPFSLMKRIMKQEKCEVFITFMVDVINRFLEHPQAQISKHIVEAFGTEEAIRIAKTPGDRIKNLRLLYQEQLNEIARFVRFFEIRDKNSRPLYYLFFASNNKLGHIKMKEAMWRIDETGNFRFSDATNPDQLFIFDYDNMVVNDLLVIIKSKFPRNIEIQCSCIRDFVENETVYLKKHMKTALKKAEEKNEIKINEYKTNGTRRRKGTYPDEAIISFI